MKNKRLKGIINILLVFIFMFSFSSNVFAVSNDKFTEANMQTEDWSNFKDQWSKIYNDYTELSLSPGVNESELNFCWYIKDSQTVDAKVMIQDKDIMDGDSFTNSAKVFCGESKSSYNGYKTNKVTVKGLVENTKYMYSYWNGSDWSKPCEYITKILNSQF